MIDRKDPKYLEALRLWDLSGMSDGWGVPGDPHARENLRYACGYLAVSNSYDAIEFLEVVLKQYVGNKYIDAMRKDIYRIAQRAGREDERGTDA